MAVISVVCNTFFVLFFFFFFQAEDGIRDLTVTGVQTCALPIWTRGEAGAGGDDRLRRPARGGGRPRRLPVLLPVWALPRLSPATHQVVPGAPGQLARLVRGVATLPGRLRPVLLPATEPRPLQAPRRDPRQDGGGRELRLHPGLRRPRPGRAPRRADRRHPGRGRSRRLRVRGGARDGRGVRDRH